MLTPYHAKLYAHELTRRCASSELEKLMPALMGARVDLNPHQIDAALFAFRSPLAKGAILADEVGLGKTIEAGLVLAQKWAERKRAILVITPASLRTQWQQELWEKFSLPSAIMDKKLFDTVHSAGHFNPFKAEKILITSYDFARKQADLLQQTEWDLVVIDEAHRLRNVYKTGQSTAKVLKNALAHAPKLLLTATPLQNSLQELYGLVSFIDDHVFSDAKTFRAAYAILDDARFTDLKARLAPLCKRTLRRQVLEYIRYTERRAHTQDFTPSPEEEDLYQRVSAFLQREKLWALPSGQRGLMILVLRKLLASSSFAIAGALQTMLERLESILHNYAAWKNETEPEEGSSPILNDFEAAVAFAEEEQALYGIPGKSIPLPEDEKAIREEALALQKLLAQARTIDANAKGTALLQALTTAFAMTRELGGAGKAIIFTESKRTQQYLYELLSQSGYAGQVLLFNGSNNDKRATAMYNAWKERHAGTNRVTGSKDVDIRTALVEEFRDRASIMIATEAASEGINLQFCSLVINYDLPWNPQRIEQRIGRCHRYGQKHDVVVVNFINRNNAADKRVFELLAEKFKLFSGVFGASDEVLGGIESGVDFEKRIAEIYQDCRSQAEIQAAFDALQASLSHEIEEGLGTARQKLLENFDAEVAEKLHVYKRDVAACLHRLESLLWEFSRFMLHGKGAVFADANLTFTLPKPLGANIPSGRYALQPQKADAAHHYHAGHPLAMLLLEKAKTAETAGAELCFDLTRSGKNISILREFVGQGGTLAAQRFTINTLEAEDHILLAGVTDGGTRLDAEQCRRLFDLPAPVQARSETTAIDTATLEPLFAGQQGAVLAALAERNTRFFDEEMDKLDRWAEERKKQLELQIDEMDRAIRQHKAEARKTAALDAKVTLQRHIKVLEAKRGDMRKRLFEAQDNVDTHKDALLDAVEARMRQNVEQETLFVIRWKLV